MSISDVMSQITSLNLAASRDSVELVKNHIDRARKGRITPSDAVDRGLKFADLLVAEEFPDTKQVIRMELSLYIWEKSIKELGLHQENKEAKNK